MGTRLATAIAVAVAVPGEVDTEDGVSVLDTAGVADAEGEFEVLLGTAEEAAIETTLRRFHHNLTHGARSGELFVAVPDGLSTDFHRS